MVRIFYYDACLIRQHVFEIEKSLDLITIRSKLERVLYLIDKLDLSFTCGAGSDSDFDAEGKNDFFLTFDTDNEDLIHDISIILDLVLQYSA